MASAFCFLLLIFFFSAVISSVSADEFLVGGVVGWRLPLINETRLYYVWASRREFYVGDSLRFRYSPVNSVVIVVKWAFYHCDPRQPIAAFHDGDTLINLDKAGTMYFITGDAARCKQGLNMTVEVISADVPENAPPPSISNTTTAPSPLPSPGELPELSPADSTASFAVSKFVTALIVGIGVFSCQI